MSENALEKKSSEKLKKIKKSDLVDRDGKLTLIGVFALLSINICAVNLFFKEYLEDDS